MQQGGDEPVASLPLPHSTTLLLPVLSGHLQPNRHPEEPHALKTQSVCETGRPIQLQLIVPALLRLRVEPHQLHLQKMMLLYLFLFHLERVAFVPTVPILNFPPICNVTVSSW